MARRILHPWSFSVLGLLGSITGMRHRNASPAEKSVTGRHQSSCAERAFTRTIRQRGTIMKKQSTSIALIVVLMAACAPMQRGRSYQESVVGGFDLKEWTVGRQRSDQNQRIVEFVRPGEKIDSWTELFTSQVLRKPPNPGPIDALVARVHADDAKLCPNGFVQNVIAQGFRTETEEASILYESKFTNCPPHADQHEVARVIYGKSNIFRLAYVAKTQALAPEKRDKVIKELSAATIMVTR